MTNQADNSTDNTAEALSEERPHPLKAPREKVIRLPLSVSVEGSHTRDVTLRRTMGWEDDMLRDETGGDKVRMARVSQILSRCTTSIGSRTRKVGNEDDHSIDPDMFVDIYEEMPVPSRSFAWVKLRQLSHGHVFKFGATCPCKKHNDGITVDLRDQNVVEATDEFCLEETHVIRGDASQGDNYTVEWSMVKGKDEFRMMKLRRDNPSNVDSAELFPYIKRVNGSKPNSVVDLLKLSSEFRSTLKDEFSVGGMDLVVTNTCKHCGREFQTMLPIFSRSFFSPGGK